MKYTIFDRLCLVVHHEVLPNVKMCSKKSGNSLIIISLRASVVFQIKFKFGLKCGIWYCFKIDTFLGVEKAA